MHTKIYMALCSILSLAGCGHNEQGGGQVLAVVEGSEITAPMLQAALEQLPDTFDRRDRQVQKTALDELVSEVVLAKQAESLKLDRTPSGARDLEGARRRVLAEAYLHKVVGDPSPSNADVVGFFTSHPYLFADRRRYAITGLQVRGRSEDVKPYVALFGQPNVDIQGVVGKLNAQGIASVPNHSNLAADQLPDVVARQLATATPGANVTYRQGSVQYFMHVDAIEPSPVTLPIAREPISRLLAQQRAAELAKSSLKHLRDAAAIQFEPTGAKIMQGNLQL